MEPQVTVAPALGAIYTKPWAVDLVLGLAGYDASRNLVDARTVEPSAGEGAFLIPIARRLLASCRAQERPWLDCLHSLRAYDVDAAALAHCRQELMLLLQEEGIPHADSAELLSAWLVEADYLLMVGRATSATPQLFDGDLEVDFVIGNPPYVRLESIPEAQNAEYRRLFPTMRGRADLYVGFYEAALRQLSPNGVCAFICADRWMLNQYGEELRRFITNGFAVDALLEVHNADAFEEVVNAYPSISILRRAQQGPSVIGHATAELENTGTELVLHYMQEVRQGEAINLAPPTGLIAERAPTWFNAGEPWTRISSPRAELLQYLEQHFAPIISVANGTRVGIGIATGADAIFFTKNPDLVEPERQLPLARTADLSTGHLVWGGHYLLSPWQNGQLIDLAAYPRLEAHFTEHRERLQKRHVGKRNPEAWYRTIDKVDEQLYHQPKLYIPDIKNSLFPVLDHGGTYPDHNLYFITSETWDLEVLGGLLLSSIGTFFVECYGVRMSGGYLRMQAQYLRKIRVPAPNTITQHQADALRHAFQNRDVAAATLAAVAVYGIGHLWPIN